MALLVAGVGIGVLSGPKVPAARERAQAPPSGPAQERYALLRRAWTPRDAMLAEPGADTAQARRARVSDEGWRIWALPKDDGLCVMGLPPSMRAPDLGPGGVCGGAQAIADGIAATTGAGPQGNRYIKGGETVVFGLVPDGVDRVELRLAAGGSRTLVVEDNSFHADVVGQTAGIRYADAAGEIHDLGGRSWDGVDGHP